MKQKTATTSTPILLLLGQPSSAGACSAAASEGLPMVSARVVMRHRCSCNPKLELQAGTPSWLTRDPAGAADPDQATPLPLVNLLPLLAHAFTPSCLCHGRQPTGLPRRLEMSPLPSIGCGSSNHSSPSARLLLIRLRLCLCSKRNSPWLTLIDMGLGEERVERMMLDLCLEWFDQTFRPSWSGP